MGVAIDQRVPGYNVLAVKGKGNPAEPWGRTEFGLRRAVIPYTEIEMARVKTQTRKKRNGPTPDGISKLGRKLMPIREKIIRSGKTYTRDEILERIRRQRAGE